MLVKNAALLVEVVSVFGGMEHGGHGGDTEDMELSDSITYM